MMKNFESTFDYKLIYIFRINDELHKGLLKIGDATVHTTQTADNLFPNCKELNQAAKARINTYTATAGISYELLHTEIATYYKTKDNKKFLQAFRDKKVHNVLIRSGIKKHTFQTDSKGQEWFKTDLQTAKNAILAVKNEKNTLNTNAISDDKSPIIFRPEQKKAIEETLSQFKKGDRMLWNAKMRFGKTLSALEVAKRAGYKKTLIFTHRPVVSDGWFEDFYKIFQDTDYVFGSKSKGEILENLVDTDKSFIYFASIQDLRGSVAVGGKFDKNDFVFLIDWDYIIVDEAHEGTQTTLGQRVLETVLSNSPTKQPKLLELSGTPFNLLSSYKINEIYTWDYIMEQKAKRDWDLQHFGDSNPYEELPKLEIFTYNLDKLIKGYIDIEDSAFNFREFFRTWTGDVKKDFKPVPNGVNIGEFVHKNDVLAFLNLMTKRDDKNNFPFSTEDYRSFYRHTLWMVPGVKEARALSSLMKQHPVFSQFKIVNVAGDGDEEENYENALEAVRDAIGENSEERYSVTISCGRLTTGVTVPEWTAVFMLAGSFSTSAANYLQTIFRVQTPANINGKIKQRCSVFDFAPDRTLKMVAEAGNLSSTAGNVSNDRILMGEFLNFCPVISIEGSSMINYNVDSLLQQLKKAYTDRVVKNGFDDRHIYNDNLLKLNEIDLKDFEKLKEIIGSTKQAEKLNTIDLNNQGFTDEEYEEIEKIEKKKKNERTPEEIAILEERKLKKDNAQKAMSILRGISIRIPLLVYGAEVPIDKDITIDNFTDDDVIDNASWEEFMPKGITKETYKKFAKYYEQDVFIAAGRQIRNMALSADKLGPTDRVKKIAEIFSMFKNPDKETVLTPWRVVNMHISDSLGGYNFYNEEFTNTIDEPIFVDRGNVTKDIFKNEDSKVLEINSKTGLYPLYITYGIFRNKIDKIPNEELDDDTVWNIWNETVKENIFVICKTPMAKAITKRTLLGYRKGKINAHAFDDLIMQLKGKPEQFKEKISRGNFWNRKEEIMKFDAVVGNPPYQEDNDNNSRKAPVYHHFYDISFKLSKIVTLITPGRFLFNAGQTPQKWNEAMLNDEHIKVVNYFPNSKDVFDNVDIKGGVAILLRNSAENFGKIGAFTTNSTIGNILEKVITYNFKPLSKIVFSKSSCGLTNLLYEDFPEYKNRLTKGNENIIDANIFEKIPEIFFDSCSSETEYSKVFGRFNNSRVYKFIKSKYLKSSANLLKYKVFITGVNGSGKMGESLSDLEIGVPNVAYTQTFMSIGSFDSEKEAENCLKYIKTKFLRLLLGTLKVTHNNSKDTWSNIPIQDFTLKSDIDWSKSITEIDKQLYKKYNFSEEEISYIEDTVKPMQ